MSSEVTLKEQREYALSYFQLHANQRMTTFNFFVVIAALLTTGISGTFNKDFQNHFFGIILGLRFIVISFTFWKLNQRVRYLIKHAETTLKAIEQEWIGESSGSGGALKSVALFSAEEEQTTGMRSQQSWAPWAWHLSYADCFGNCIFHIWCIGVFGCARGCYQMAYLSTGNMSRVRPLRSIRLGQLVLYQPDGQQEGVWPFRLHPLYCGWEAHYLLLRILRKKPIVIHNHSMHSMDRASVTLKRYIRQSGIRPLSLKGP